MDSRDAELALADAELLPLVEGSLAHVKALRDTCLAADVPVLLARPQGAGKS